MVVCYPLSWCFLLITYKFPFPHLTFYPSICANLPYNTCEFEILYLSIWDPTNRVYPLLSVYLQSNTCVFALLYESVLLYMHADLANAGQNTLLYLRFFPSYLSVYLLIPPSLPFHAIQSVLIYLLFCPLIPASLFFHTSQSFLPYQPAWSSIHISLASHTSQSVLEAGDKSDQYTNRTQSFNHKAPSISSPTALLLLLSAHIFLPL